jgi:hypothetical protein
MESTNELKIFEAIKDFIVDLNTVFGTNSKSPLDLYYRLVQHVKPESNLEKFITGFKVFFCNYDKDILKLEDFLTIPRDTYIRYGSSPNIYIEIQKFIFKSKTNTVQLETIRNHLLTISALIDPNEKTLDALNSAAPILEKMGLGASKEAQLVQNTFLKAKKSMEGIDSKDPTQAIMGLLSSGVIPDLIANIQDGVQNKTLDINKLLPSMSQMLGSLQNGDSDDDEKGESKPLDVDALMLGMQGLMGNKQEKVSEIDEQ